VPVALAVPVLMLMAPLQVPMAALAVLAAPQVLSPL